MKWIKKSAAFLTASLLASFAFAQEEPATAPKSSKEKNEEIVIRKNNGKEQKMTIVIDGDDVTINGKPMGDFKDGDVKIIKRKNVTGSLSRNLPRIYMGTPDGRFSEDMEDMVPSGVNKAMLGVMTEKAEDGAKINEVTKESGAEKAGLKEGDIITKVGTSKISDPKDLTEAIGKYNPGDKVDIVYKRNGKESKTNATLKENKSKRISMKLMDKDFNFRMPDGVELPDMENFNFSFSHKPKLGLQIQDIEEGKGVKIKEVEEASPSSKAGLKEGDVITQINGKDIDGVDDLRSQTKDLKEGDAIKLSFKRDGKVQTADIKIPKKLKTADL